MAENLKLKHDVNAGRFVIPTLPPSLQNTDLGRYLQDAFTRLSNALQQEQRAFRTLGGTVDGEDVLVLQDITHDGTDWIKTFIVVKGLASGGTSTSTIEGVECDT